MNVFWKIAALILAGLCGVLGTIVFINRRPAAAQVPVVTAPAVQETVVRFAGEPWRELNPQLYAVGFKSGMLTLNQSDLTYLCSVTNRSGKRWAEAKIEYNLLSRGAVTESKTEYANNIEPGQVWKFQASRERIAVTAVVTSLAVR